MPSRNAQSTNPPSLATNNGGKLYDQRTHTHQHRFGAWETRLPLRDPSHKKHTWTVQEEHSLFREIVRTMYQYICSIPRPRIDSAWVASLRAWAPIYTTITLCEDMDELHVVGYDRIKSSRARLVTNLDDRPLVAKDPPRIYALQARIVLSHRLQIKMMNTLCAGPLTQNIPSIQHPTITPLIHQTNNRVSPTSRFTHKCANNARPSGVSRHRSKYYVMRPMLDLNIRSM
ncbi:unnamed protein product [Scytosiphon promiscuus]